MCSAWLMSLKPMKELWPGAVVKEHDAVVEQAVDEEVLSWRRQQRERVGSKHQAPSRSASRRGRVDGEHDVGGSDAMTHSSIVA